MEKASKGKGKSHGKGKSKDKGKAASSTNDRGPVVFQGYCDWCWLWGHTQRQCTIRKQYLAEQRWTDDNDRDGDMDVGGIAESPEEVAGVCVGGVAASDPELQYVF